MTQQRFEEIQQLIAQGHSAGIRTEVLAALTELSTEITRRGGAFESDADDADGGDEPEQAERRVRRTSGARKK